MRFPTFISVWGSHRLGVLRPNRSICSLVLYACSSSTQQAGQRVVCSVMRCFAPCRSCCHVMAYSITKPGVDVQQPSNILGQRVHALWAIRVCKAAGRRLLNDQAATELVPGRGNEQESAPCVNEGDWWLAWKAARKQHVPDMGETRRLGVHPAPSSRAHLCLIFAWSKTVQSRFYVMCGLGGCNETYA